MIQGLVLAMLTSIFTTDYLVRDRGWLHPYFLLTPELLSAIAMVVVFARLVAGKRFEIDWRYGLFFVLLLGTIVFGYILQPVPQGAMVAGVRAYLKFLPFLLLPMVYPFSAKQVKQQLLLVLVLLSVQTPLAVYQRFIEFAGKMDDGDPIKGTTTTSSSLSMFMVCAIAGLVALYVRGRMKLIPLIFAMGWFFLPTTINETKATIILLPFALLVPALAMPKGSRALSKLWPIVGVGAVAAVAYIAVYNSLIVYKPYGQSLGDFVSGDGFNYYLYTGAAEHDAEYIGRFDSLEFAIDHVTRDPITFAIGLGASNVQESFLPQFAGKYSAFYWRFGVGQTQVGQLLWEVGVVGLFTYLLLFYFISRDSLLLARTDGPDADLGRVWTVAMIVMTFGLIYKTFFTMNDVGYLFFYFSGIVAARAIVLRRAQRASATSYVQPSWQYDGNADDAMAMRRGMSA